MGIFQGLPTQEIKNQFITIEYLSTAGPRIVRLSAFGRQNLLAEVNNQVETPFGSFHFRGGHRLWHAPEAIPRTYIPDNNGVTVEKNANGVKLNGSIETGTGLQKSIEIQLTPNQPEVTLIHTITNHSFWPLEFSPWAITMFRLGGTVIIPQCTEKSDTAGLLHNRTFSLWPYSQINDQRVALRDDYILIKALPKEENFKIGTFNPHGWIGYWLEGTLFVKVFEVEKESNHPDGNCNCESFCCGTFVELESLGPMRVVQPGEIITHTEKWLLFKDLQNPFVSRDLEFLL